MKYVEQEVANKKATKKPFVVNRKMPGNYKKKVEVDLSTELNQLCKQDCFDYMTAVAKLHMI